MKAIIVVLALVTLTTVLEAKLTDKCLQCLCAAEPNCAAVSLGADKHCRWCIQIRIGGKKRSIPTNDAESCGSMENGQNPCSDKTKCTPNCIASYVKTYGPQCSRRKAEPTCLDYAAAQKGGPKACLNHSSFWYIRKVAKCCHSLGGCN